MDLDLLTRLRDRRGEGNACRCELAFVERTGTGIDDRVELVVCADDCPGDGDLVAAPACRATVVDALADRDADAVLVRVAGRERAYVDRAAALLLAAGRLVERVAHREERLAARARRDPLGAAREATGRAGPAARVAVETGLAAVAGDCDGYDEALGPYAGPTVARSRIARQPPTDARLRGTRDLPTGATVRTYAVPGTPTPRYHLVPTEATLGAEALATLAAAADLLAGGEVGGGDRAPGRAVRRVADADAPVERLSAVLRKHTRGNGVLDDLFADERLSDAFVTAPASANPVRVVVDGEPMRTNVRLTPDGAATLASRLRRTSGRPFSRANPTLDAVVDVGTGSSAASVSESSPSRIGDEGDGARVRVAGVTRPVSDGLAFAFRRHGGRTWTLPALVENGTLTPEAAALLATAVERGAAGLVAGHRGAGKTTLLGALCWALPPDVRAVLIEDTPELPVAALQAAGRDVQPLRVGTGPDATTTPAEALRTALRLGDGALVVGEVRGEEAATLYEAMRVGAAGDAVLGTIHGDGARAVRERVVADLGVPATAFAATDLVVTCAAEPTRRVARVEEIRRVGDEVAFEPLHALDADALSPTGPVDRGESHLVGSLARPDESYADVREVLAARADRLGTMADCGATRPGDAPGARDDPGTLELTDDAA